MYTFHCLRSTRFTACLALIVLSLPCSAQELDKKDQLKRFFGNTMEPKEAKKYAAALATLITNAAHPSAQDVDCLKHEIKWGDRVCFTRMHVEYYGGLTGKQYAATINIVLNTLDGDDQWQVDRITFDDAANRIPASKQKLAAVKRKLNKVLSDE